MKMIIISGANGQMGSYLANEYYREGYQLGLLYHNRDDRLRMLIDKPGIVCIKSDLQDRVATHNAVDEIRSHFGTSPEALIHTAALRSFDAKPLYLSDPDVFHRIMEVNIFSAYNLLHAVLPLMKESGYGRVVLLGSDVTQTGLKNGAAYAAAKSAMVSLVKSAAKEMAAWNVLINAISPGPVETVLEEDYQGEYLEFRKNYFENYKKTSPTGKLIRLNEVKRMIDLLISTQITNLTGEELQIRGGLT